jgi:hypothetical protein
MTKKASETFDEGVEATDESFALEDGETTNAIEDIAPETVRNAATTRRRIEDYLEERQIKRLIDEFDFHDGEKPKKK